MLPVIVCFYGFIVMRDFSHLSWVVLNLPCICCVEVECFVLLFVACGFVFLIVFGLLV